MIGIIYAIISMLFAGVNDFLFKEASDRAHTSMGWFIAGIGLVQTIIFSVSLYLTGTSITGTHWPVSVGAGMASLVANVLFLGSYRYFPASSGATIYRLNLIVVAILSFLLLGESVTIAKITGISFGVVAVLALCNRSSAADHKAGKLIGVWMLVIACLLRAVMGILYKVASLQGIPSFELLTICGICWMLGGIVVAAIIHEPIKTDKILMRTSLVSGILVCGIVYFMFAATKVSDASIVVPITQMGFLLTSALGVVYHGEILTLKKGCAMIAAVCCIVSLSHH